jgi:hypothetical protein
MRKKRRLRAHAFGADQEQQHVEAVIRKHLEYMVAEGICIIDRIDDDGEPVYRLKTQEEIDQELADILNS